MKHYGKPHVMRGEGDGTTFYLGDKQGAPFLGVNLKGFSGWRSDPMWMPGGWEFFEPTLHVGRLFTEGGRIVHLGTVLLPAKLVSVYRWRIRPSGRRYMREHPESFGSM